MTPQISAGATGEVYSYRQPGLTYRLGADVISGHVDGLESVQQAIYHILSTERYSNPIYDDDYGVELEQYLGKDIGYITADIENTLTEALTQDDRITGVQVNDISKSTEQESACVIDFTVFTIYGKLEETMNVLQ